MNKIEELAAELNAVRAQLADVLDRLPDGALMGSPRAKREKAASDRADREAMERRDHIAAENERRRKLDHQQEIRLAIAEHLERLPERERERAFRSHVNTAHTIGETMQDWYSEPLNTRFRNQYNGCCAFCCTCAGHLHRLDPYPQTKRKRA